MKILLCLLVLFTAYLLGTCVGVYRKINISKKIVQNTQAYQLPTQDFTTTLLALGDSTAVGVGAEKPEDSVPALLGGFLQATFVENQAVSGAKIADVNAQIQLATKKHYTHILLQIGSNNIVARQSTTTSEEELRAVLKTLPPHQYLTVLMCGDVGTAPLIPWFIRPYYTRKTLEYHALLERVVPEYGGQYVNLYTPPRVDPFVQEPETYFSKDQFHPSTAGYQVWFEKVAQFF